MIEVFSRTDIPRELLTDQGSVFTGKIMKELCSTLKITHLQTYLRKTSSRTIRCS